MPKFVASRTPQQPTWNNTTVLNGDLATEVNALKGRDGRDILKFGTGIMDGPLIEHGLVDEFHFWVFPVVAGSG